MGYKFFIVFNIRKHPSNKMMNIFIITIIFSNLYFIYMLYKYVNSIDLDENLKMV